MAARISARQADIATLAIDAIVNAANSSLLERRGLAAIADGPAA